VAVAAAGGEVLLPASPHAAAPQRARLPTIGGDSAAIRREFET
jgi:hypothetical protein